MDHAIDDRQGVGPAVMTTAESLVPVYARARLLAEQMCTVGEDLAVGADVVGSDAGCYSGNSCLAQRGVFFQKMGTCRHLCVLQKSR